MQALLLLEHSIDPHWRKRGMRDAYVAFCPSWHMALRHATYPSIALRLWGLDQLIDYDRTESITTHEGRKAKAANRLKAQQMTEDYLVTEPKGTQSSTRKRYAEAPVLSGGGQSYGGSAGKKYKRYG